MIDPGTLPDGEEYKAYCRRPTALGWILGPVSRVRPAANWARKRRLRTGRRGRIHCTPTACCSRRTRRASAVALPDVICRKLYEEGERVIARDETVGAAAEEAGVVDGARLAASDEGLDELKAQLKNQSLAANA